MGASDLSKKRNANMDLLRMLSMMMVTMLHALGKSELLLPMGAGLPVNGWVAWILECFSIGAVNIFMLLSGYYLIRSEYKIARLLEILFQTCFYTVGSFLVFWGLKWLSGEQTDVYHLLQYFLPIHMDVYWFITAYVVIYLCLPILSAGVRGVSKRGLEATVVGLLCYECLFKSVLPVRLEVDAKGYSFLWYLTVFLIGAYFRIYGIPLIKKAWQGCLLYVAGTVLVFLELFALYFVHERTGHFGEGLQVSLNYNHAFVLLAAVGIFTAFLLAKPIRAPWEKMIQALTPMALGVYLLQESPVLRYEWQKWFGLRQALGEATGLFLLRVFGAVIAMYLLGSFVDALRILLFRGIARGISSHAKESGRGKEKGWS